MKKKQIVLTALLITVFLISRPANAAAKNVTRSFKDKKTVVKMIKQFAGLTYLDGKRSYDFSKNKDRKRALKWIVGDWYSDYGDGMSVPVKVSKRVSARLFGRATSGLKKAVTGDWGGAYPEFTTYRFYKNSSFKYLVEAEIYWVEEDDNITRHIFMGDVSFEVQKKKGSYYGYIVKKMKVKYDNEWLRSGY